MRDGQEEEEENGAEDLPRHFLKLKADFVSKRISWKNVHFTNFLFEIARRLYTTAR